MFPRNKADKHAAQNVMNERTPLLGDEFDSDTVDSIDQTKVSWQHETRIIAVYTAPLIVTGLLQTSIMMSSAFVLSRLGPKELGAVTLANQSAFITMLTPFQGLVTSLDTLCAQAFGAGNTHLVGVHCQRMTVFLLLLSIPVIILWINAEEIFNTFVPDPDTPALAGAYLRHAAFGIPGFVLFEVGKRFVQAQCLFRATTYALLIAAPTNIFLQWFLVWKMELGFVGGPIASALTFNLLPILLLLYVWLIDGSKCWGGFSRNAFVNWLSMLKMAIPAMIMIEVEGLAFEVMTLFATRFGNDLLTAQSIMIILSGISYQTSFPLSIAVGTRVAHLVGAGDVDGARRASKVALGLVLSFASVIILVYAIFHRQIPLLFTDDETISALAISHFPLMVLVQVFDCISDGAHGLLRGVGRQYIGGPATLIAYYAVALPIALGLCIGLGWKLEGMWTALAVGLISVSLFEFSYAFNVNWEKVAKEAETRNAAG